MAYCRRDGCEGEINAASINIAFDFRARKKGRCSIDLPEVPVIRNAMIAANTKFVRGNEAETLVVLTVGPAAFTFLRPKKQKVCEILSRELAALIHFGE